MKHKHADLIKAWADGAEIQALSDDGKKWNDCNSAPNWNPFRTYRIKPEPKPDVVMYLIASFDEENKGRGFVEPDQCFSVVTKNLTSGDNLKLTFDGETGELKSAEVLK